MKKILSFLCLVLCFPLLFSCAKEEKSTKVEFQPLFRFQVEEGAWAETLLWYCPESDGFLYFHPGEEGAVGGFVSPSRSLSSESLIRNAGSLSAITARETGKDKLFVLSEAGLFTAFPGGGSQKTELPEGFPLNQAVFYDDLSFMTVRDGKILLHPVDFAQTYVMAVTSGLTDFAAIMGPSKNGERIWYAKGAEGAYTGIAFFEYGANLPLGSETFAFDSFFSTGEGRFLFINSLEDGGTHYLWRDLDAGTTRSLVTDETMDRVTVTPDGAYLCGYRTQGETSLLSLYEMETGKLLGTHTVNYGTPAALALSHDAKTLLLVIGSQKDEVIGTLNLEPFLPKK